MASVRVLVWGCCVLVGAGCSERAAPPVVAPVVKPVPVAEIDAGVDAGSAEPEPDNILQLPDTATLNEDPNRPAELIRLMLRDPELTERRLAALDTPSQWQVALLANFALRRGERSLPVPREGDLPPITLDGGTLEAGKKAWVSVPLADLKPAGAAKKKPTLATLPIGTQVEIDALDGGVAFVAVPLATSVEFSENDEVPTHIDATVVKGQLDLAALSSTPVQADALIAEAQAQPTTDVGLDRAVALWYRALLIDHSERTREGLLTAAWNAHRPSWAVTAALDRTFAPARNLSLTWGCRGEASRAKLTRWPLNKKSPADVCVTGISEQLACETDSPALKRQLDTAKADLDASGLVRKPTLNFTVDARIARRLFVANSRLEVIDNCADFREVKVEGWGAAFRVLRLPLGIASAQVRVAVPSYHGVEYAVVSGASEAKIAAWLRSRGRNRWTFGRNGELNPSLQNGDSGFKLEGDVSAVTFATAPLRGCDCE